MDLIERIAFLERAEIFGLVEAECLGHAAMALEEEDAPAGRLLYAPGEPADYIYFVREGEVRLALAGGGSLTAGPGDSFGYEEVVLEFERMHAARAQAPCQLLKLGRGQAAELFTSDPGFARGVVRTLLARQTLLVAREAARPTA